MKKIACLYTGYGGGLCQALEKEFKEAVGEDIKFYHIGESCLMRDIIEANGVTQDVRARLFCLLDAACKTKPDIVVCTCSSIGEVAEEAAKNHPEVKIIRIDDPMARMAVSQYKKIGVMATLSTTVGPSCRLVERIAKGEGKSVQVVSATAEGAFPAMMSGNMDKAVELIKETAKQLSAQGAEVLLLAQASMGMFADMLQELTGLPVYTSPRFCAQYLKKEIG